MPVLACDIHSRTDIIQLDFVHKNIKTAIQITNMYGCTVSNN